MIVSPAIAKIIAGLTELDADLAKLSTPANAETFCTSGPRAPGVSRRTHNETLRSGRVAGAYRDGREWVCTREAWFAARARRPAIAPVLQLVQSPSDEDRALAMLEASGHRIVTRQGSKR